MVNYGNPHRDPRTGRFTSAIALAAISRVHRLTTLGGDLDALCRYDIDIAALALLHAAVNIAVTQLHHALPTPDQTGEVTS